MSIKSAHYFFTFLLYFYTSYTLTKNSDFWYNGFMSESQKISENDNMGREKFWEDLGRPESSSWSLKLFKEQCCDNCSCKNSNE